MKQLLLDKIISNKQNSISQKILFKILVAAKNKLYSGNRSLVNYNLDGKFIQLPVTHDLPVNRNINPHYSENLGRLTAYTKTKYNDLKLIDIGANIGDSVYIIKAHADVPVLCVEGDSRFFSLLEHNTRHWKDVHIEKTFVGDKNQENAEYVTYKGSGLIIKSDDPSKKILFKDLSAILNSNELFNDFKFIKIDTDGFDCKIIRNEINLFSRLKPVIFFEYDPFLFGKSNDDGLSVFAKLKEAGYNKVIFYLNTGEYLVTTELDQHNVIEDLHHFYSGKNGDKYYDIAVFHKEDDDLAEIVRKKEIDFFKNAEKK